MAHWTNFICIILAVSSEILAQCKNSNTASREKDKHKHSNGNPGNLIIEEESEVSEHHEKHVGKPMTSFSDAEKEALLKILQEHYKNGGDENFKKFTEHLSHFIYQRPKSPNRPHVSKPRRNSPPKSQGEGWPPASSNNHQGMCRLVGFSCSTGGWDSNKRQKSEASKVPKRGALASHNDNDERGNGWHSNSPASGWNSNSAPSGSGWNSNSASSGSGWNSNSASSGSGWESETEESPGWDSQHGGWSGWDSQHGGGSGWDSQHGGWSGWDSQHGGWSGWDSQHGGWSGWDSQHGGGSGWDSQHGGGSGWDSQHGGWSGWDSDWEATTGWESNEGWGAGWFENKGKCCNHDTCDDGKCCIPTPSTKSNSRCKRNADCCDGGLCDRELGGCFKDRGQNCSGSYECYKSDCVAGVCCVNGCANSTKYISYAKCNNGTDCCTGLLCESGNCKVGLGGKCGESPCNSVCGSAYKCGTSGVCCLASGSAGCARDSDCCPQTPTLHCSGTIKKCN